jgi:hypothetical protein
VTGSGQFPLGNAEIIVRRKGRITRKDNTRLTYEQYTLDDKQMPRPNAATALVLYHVLPKRADAGP